MNLPDMLPADWRSGLTPFLDPRRTAALGEFVAGQYRGHTV